MQATKETKKEFYCVKGHSVPKKKRDRRHGERGVEGRRESEGVRAESGEYDINKE